MGQAVRRNVWLWTMVMWAVYSLQTFAVRAPLPLAALDWPTTAKQSEKAVVPILSQKDGDTYVCTGFVIDANAPKDTDRILTAAHCEKGSMYVDGVAPTVLYKDVRSDLMVLEVPDLDRPALKLAAHDPVVQQDVLSVGYGGGLEKPVTRRANISVADVALDCEICTGRYFVTDAPFVGGQSGGPCVDTAGAIVMIVQIGDVKMGAGRGAEEIRHKVGRFFAKDPAPKKP